MSKTIEEIIKEVGYTFLGTKMSFSYNEAKEIAERAVKSKTQELQEQNAELVEMLEAVADAIELGGYVPVEYIRERLTKYSHLKSNTNGSI